MSAQIQFAERENFASVFAETSADWFQNMSGTDTEKKALPRENRNISNIISRIRDEGSAFAEDKLSRETVDDKPSGRIKPEIQERVTTQKVQTETVPFCDDIDEDVLSISSSSGKVKNSSGIMSDVMSAERERIATKKNPSKLKSGLLLPATLTVLAVTALSVALYQFKLQSDEMKSTLLMYQEKLVQQDTATGITQENSAPVLLAQNSKVASGIDEKNFLSLSSEEAIPAPEMNSVTDASTLVLASEAESSVSVSVVSRLQSEAGGVRETTAATDVSTSDAEEKAEDVQYRGETVAADVSVETSVASEGLSFFTVNLASFSNREKALDQLGRFKATRILPVIEEAVVNGKTVYRLCVEGFSSRDEAAVFITTVRKKFGFNAWVRKA